MEEFDCLIVGAGAVGLAVAKDLALSGFSVLLIDRHDSFGRETSSRNSEVIHGGMYYPNGSLKAKLCVEGRHLLYDFCSMHKVSCRKTGKIIVATTEEELSFLEKIFQLGNSNGVERLRIIDKKDIKDFEPEVTGIKAIYSPETGILDSYGFMLSLNGLAKEQGAMISYNSIFLRAEKKNDGYLVFIQNGADLLKLKVRTFINSAGLDSDIVAQNSGFDIDKYHYRMHYCKGQYFRLNSSKAGKLRMLVYPVPKPLSAGLGVHVTLDMAGGVRLGPDDEYLGLRSQDYSVDPLRRVDFYESVRQFIPFITEGDLSVDTAGIRPKLQGPGEDFRDFIISDESEKGFPGFINLIGIESPGLTASLAIAGYVKNRISEFL